MCSPGNINASLKAIRFYESLCGIDVSNVDQIKVTVNHLVSDRFEFINWGLEFNTELGCIQAVEYNPDKSKKRIYLLCAHKGNLIKN